MNILERRFYFIAGDTLSNGITGMATAQLATSMVDHTWHMASAMLTGMGVGMGFSMILMPVFVGLFGAMEVMLPVMLTAMMAGMVFAMANTMLELSIFEVLLGGALIGIFVLSLTYVADALLRRKSL